MKALLRRVKGYILGGSTMAGDIRMMTSQMCTWLPESTQQLSKCAHVLPESTQEMPECAQSAEF